MAKGDETKKPWILAAHGSLITYAISRLLGAVFMTHRHFELIPENVQNQIHRESFYPRKISFPILKIHIEKP